jgi:hypothetical protein
MLFIGTLVYSVALSLAFIIVSIFQCRPISYFWLRWDGEHTGQCIDEAGFIWSSAILTIALDCWILVLPLPFIARLQLSLRKKILAGGLFGVGIWYVFVFVSFFFFFPLESCACTFHHC